MKVFRCLLKLDFMPPGACFKLFDAQVQSILLNGSELWGISHCYVVESVQFRFLDLLIQVPKVMVYGNKGRYPLYIVASTMAMKYYLHFLKMEPSG